MYCYVFSKKLKSFVKPKPARVLVLMERGVKRSALGPVAFDDAIQSITVGGPDIQAEDWSNPEVKNKSKDVEGSKDVPNVCFPSYLLYSFSSLAMTMALPPYPYFNSLA